MLEACDGQAEASGRVEQIILIDSLPPPDSSSGLARLQNDNAEITCALI